MGREWVLGKPLNVPLYYEPLGGSGPKEVVLVHTSSSKDEEGHG
jgi:hypothetical protein